MSNRVSLVATTFDSYMLGTDCKTHGFRIYDNEDQCYDNNSENPITDDLELLKYAISCSIDGVVDILHFIYQHQSGIEINGQWYDWDEISKCFS